MIISGDIRNCLLTAKPPLSKTEQLILPEDLRHDREVNKNGATISGKFL